MPGRINSPDAGHDLIPRLDEGRAIGEWRRELHEKLSIELPRLPHLATQPEIEFRRSEYIARLGKHRRAGFHQPADMIGMTVGDDDDIDIFRPIAELAHPLDQAPIRQAATKRFALALQGAVAGVEQHQLRPGMHQDWNERMFVAKGIDPVGAGQRLHLLGHRRAAMGGA